MENNNISASAFLKLLNSIQLGANYPFTIVHICRSVSDPRHQSVPDSGTDWREVIAMATSTAHVSERASVYVQNNRLSMIVQGCDFKNAEQLGRLVRRLLSHHIPDNLPVIAIAVAEDNAMQAMDIWNKLKRRVSRSVVEKKSELIVCRAHGGVLVFK